MYVCVCVCARARACVCASFYGHVDRRNKLSVEIVKIELTFILCRLCVCYRKLVKSYQPKKKEEDEYQ